MPEHDNAQCTPCAVLVPALNEAATIGSVVEVARRAALGPVWVVDDGSADATADRAAAAGARVLRLPSNVGKGGALCAGAAVVAAEVLVVVDADLVGLEPAHLRALAAPVLVGEADMTRGVFRGGRWSTTAAQRLIPQLNGQRALRRADLAAVPGLADSRYGVEVRLTEHARRRGWRCVDVPLDGVSHVMKEEKRGLWRGLRVRLRMYRDIVSALLRRGRHA
jgi:glycosyltransferase involved in cell wall biosynthesis